MTNDQAAALSKAMGFQAMEYDLFTDAPTAESDRRFGQAAAWAMGDTWIDSRTMSPREQWTQIVKTLRLHGMQITAK